MIIPLFHERTAVRSIPWVSIAIALLCLLAFASLLAQWRLVAETDARFDAALGYWMENPWLETDPRLLPPEVRAELDQELLELGRREFPTRLQQRRLAAVTGAWLAAVERDPLWDWALVPGDFYPVDLLSYAFLHGDLLHLFGNLLFFYLTAPWIEDAFGRVGFALFYAGGAVASGLVYMIAEWGLFRPMVGASGAISALMAAFLVLFWSTRVRVLLWICVPLGIFRVPAWVLFPLWFCFDLVAALEGLGDPLSGYFGGTAYWAHIGGFLFGLAVTLTAVRVVGREELVGPEDDTPDTQPGAGLGHDNEVIVATQKKVATGDWEGAWSDLHRAATSGVATPLALEMYWDLSLDLERSARALPAMLRRIRSHLRDGEREKALELWARLRRATPERPPDLRTLIALAEAHLAAGDRGRGRALLEGAVAVVRETSPVGTVMKILRLSDGLDRELHREAVARALAHPALPAEVRRELELSVL